MGDKYKGKLQNAHLNTPIIETATTKRNAELCLNF